MGYTIEWDDAEPHVLLITYRQQWTWDEVEEVITKLLKLLDDTPQTVDFIYVIVMDDWAPGIMPHMSRLLQLIEHPGYGISIAVTTGMLPKLMLTILQRTNRVFAGRLFITPTLEAAHDLIRRHRQNQTPPQ